ncbi:hypothetical protein [Novosphingobium sp. UBA1939]|uniref:hypothetical protein n=1 Tax=Novosphingobium sp. UBA1939 TaxID=1946982 RepID=UPI0025D2A55E|nr:hypothetical protein [Novosphingobium sp. UBA1939]
MSIFPFAWRKKIDPIFLLTVAIPTFLSILYFGFVASDVYVSESHFVVRSPDKQNSSALGALLKAPGVSVAGDEIYAVQQYVESRDALKALNRDGFVDRLISAPGLDPFARFYSFGWRETQEGKYRYFQHRVDVQNDTISSISTMKVRAYRAQDAYEMNKRLLDLGEALVNRLNNRSRQDLIRFSQEEVGSARKEAERTALALAAFRNRSGLVDPEQQAGIELQLISKLQDEFIAAKTQLLQLRAYTPENPQIPVLRTRIEGISAEIDREIAKVAGGGQSLASASVEYQRLVLESKFADRQLASAMTSLESARNDARRKQVYLERIVEPSVPDEPAEPKRLRNIFSTLVLGLVAWGVLSMLLAGLREHRD